MNWNKFTIDTTTEAADLICSSLMDLGIDSVEIEDFQPVDDELQGGTFEELQPDMPEDDGSCKINFYIDEDIEFEKLLDDVRNEIEELRSFVEVGSGTITIDITHQEDWINNWKKYFGAFRIEDILITPTWEAEPATNDYRTLIKIDPGISFGTGKHESTKACIIELRKYVEPNMKVLDVGCGSGILSVAALKLGATSAVGTDIDEACIESSFENFDVNDIDRQHGKFFKGNLIDNVDFQNQIRELGPYDIVCANILADIIIPMLPALVTMMGDKTMLITSGIIDFKEDEVKSAMEENGLEVVNINHLGEWVGITAKKRG